MASTSAADLLTSFDCAAPGCRGEAEVAGGLCLFCTRAAREQAREGAAHAGKLETGVLALMGLARELNAELRSWHAEVEEARGQLAARRR
jgi:hypothetical protein